MAEMGIADGIIHCLGLAVSVWVEGLLRDAAR